MSRFLLNDASLHGQFLAAADFWPSLSTIFQMRKTLERAGFRLEVNRMLTQRPAVNERSFREVVGGSNNRELVTSILSWLDKDGPFWDDPPVHLAGEYFECEAELVTETALAEACSLLEYQVHLALLGFSPSRFCRNPLEVRWRGRPDGDRSWELPNFCSEALLAEYVQRIERPLTSWEGLLAWVARNCTSLLLSDEIPSQLPTTFYSNVADRAKVLLKALDDINIAIQQRNEVRFQELRTVWFEGANARMTDSSDTEKVDFVRGLTFNSPLTGQDVLCSWHAKIKSPQYRIHFEWPKTNPDSQLFIAYLGPKITKR